jgi:hypothetical protein
LPVPTASGYIGATVTRKPTLVAALVAFAAAVSGCGAGSSAPSGPGAREGGVRAARAFVEAVVTNRPRLALSLTSPRATVRAPQLKDVARRLGAYSHHRILGVERRGEIVVGSVVVNGSVDSPSELETTEYRFVVGLSRAGPGAKVTYWEFASTGTRVRPRPRD